MLWCIGHTHHQLVPNALTKLPLVFIRVQVFIGTVVINPGTHSGFNIFMRPTCTQINVVCNMISK